MNFQYITDTTGLPTGVYIPISEWDKLMHKHKELQSDFIEIPETHKIEVRKRLAEYENDNTIGLDFNAEMDKIENGL